MSNINYSIRLDEELRERMREVPDMPERIRDFIGDEVKRYEQGKPKGKTAAEQFLHRVLDEYDIVGAYCLWRLDDYVFDERAYLQNVEARFENSDLDIGDARLSAKRIRDEWNDQEDIPDELVEDVLDVRGYVDEFYTHARDVAQEAEGTDRWALWTVTQLFRNEEAFRDGTTKFNIKQKSITKTLERHGYDEEEIEQALGTLIGVGGLQDLYDSTAYFYHYLKFPDYVVDAIEEGLHNLTREVRTTVSDYCEEEPYVDSLLELTRGSDHKPYEKELEDEQKAKRVVQEGAVVLKYSPSRSSTGRRSSLPKELRCVLSPAVRDVVSDAVYRHKTEMEDE